MLGNYRTMGITSTNNRDTDTATNLPHILGQLATDPNVSMYATEALVKQGTVAAKQALIEALKEARGWAKVDVIEGCLALKQEHFYDMIISSGLDSAPGLESYIAIPVYRTIPIEQYFSTQYEVSPRLQANAALIVQRVLRDSMNPPGNESAKPPIFERYFPLVAQELFAAAQRNPTWQYAVALHYLGLFMGRYWNEISRNTIMDGSIIEQIYAVSTQMNNIEHWMAGPGRDALLRAIADPQEENIILIARILGELQEPRATTPMLERLEHAKTPPDRTHALTLGALCDTLGHIGDRRTAIPMLQFINRTIDIHRRSQQPKRRANLPFTDPDVPGSIIYAAVIRALGQLGERSAIENTWLAASDLDPYVRTQALATLQHLDPQGEYQRSREVARESINDPNESVIQQGIQLVAQYNDSEAVPILRHERDNRPELSHLFQEALRKLGQ
jgi:HEAT repeat protein